MSEDAGPLNLLTCVVHRKDFLPKARAVATVNRPWSFESFTDRARNPGPDQNLLVFPSHLSRSNRAI